MVLREESGHSEGAPDVRRTLRIHRGTGVSWRYAVGSVALAALVALIAQNSQRVEFEWLWFAFKAPLAVMLLATVVVTLIFAALGGLIWRHRRGPAPAREAKRTRNAMTGPPVRRGNA
jgi:uncharacterized integral membrane protein